LQLRTEAVLLSVHPQHAQKILDGRKNLEFRRVWPREAISFIVIYSTAPLMRIVGAAEITGVVRASAGVLWGLATESGGGVTRAALRSYLKGKSNGIALQLGRRFAFERGLEPQALFGAGFRAPQSFRYLTASELAMITKRSHSPSTKEWQ
jgi:predicted transcriptional regulator